MYTMYIKIIYFIISHSKKKINIPVSVDRLLSQTTKYQICCSCFKKLLSFKQQNIKSMLWMSLLDFPININLIFQ